jgi:glucosamine--fructose-6-phosphate aminotransferase (isomerizing)
LVRLLEDSPVVLPLVDQMTSARNLFLVGCGSSYNACILGAIYLARLAGRPAIPILAPQFVAQYGPTLSSQDTAVFVSQSGETKDVLDAEELACSHGCHTLGLVNVIGSSLTKKVERYLPIACGYEISAAATKTFTNQSVALLYLALQMASLPSASLSRLPELLECTLQGAEDQVRRLETHLADWPEMYCLGYGATYPIALEGALKIKQTTYLHCEGMLSTEFKHGSLSAVTQDYPVLFIAGPEDTALMISGINEVTCRGGKALVIAEGNPQLQANANHLLTLPQAGPLLAPLAAILPLQMLAYRMSLRCGFDPDYPRNLTKSYTVD